MAGGRSGWRAVDWRTWLSLGIVASVLACALGALAGWLWVRPDTLFTIYVCLLLAGVALYREPARAWPDSPGGAIRLVAALATSTLVCLVLVVAIALLGGAASFGVTGAGTLAAARASAGVSILLALAAAAGFVTLLPWFQRLGSLLKRTPQALGQGLAVLLALLLALISAALISSTSSDSWSLVAVVLASAGAVALLSRPLWALVHMIRDTVAGERLRSRASAPDARRTGWSRASVLRVAALPLALLLVSFVLGVVLGLSAFAVLWAVWLLSLAAVVVAGAQRLGRSFPRAARALGVLVTAALLVSLVPLASAQPNPVPALLPALIWLLTVGIAWLAAPLLPESMGQGRWATLFLGVFGLLVAAPALLPLLFRTQSSFNYRVTLPVYLAPDSVIDPTPANFASWVCVAAALFFGALVWRAGGIVLGELATPKRAALPAILCTLGVFVALGSTSYFDTYAVLATASKGEWRPAALPADFSGTPERVFSDAAGNVWVATQSYPYAAARYDATAKTWQVYRAASNGLPAGAITQIFDDPQGGTWLVFAHGAARVDDTGAVTFVDAAGSSALEQLGTDLNTIFRDSQGTLWAGTGNGVARRTGDAPWQPSETGPYDIRGIGEDPGGHVWFLAAGSLFVAAVPLGGQAHQFGPQAGEVLTTSLDLGGLSGPITVTLTLGTGAARSDAAAARLSVSTDGGTSWDCPRGLSSRDPTCAFAYDGHHARSLSYDLSPYAGQALSLRLDAAGTQPAAWYVLGATVSHAGEQMHLAPDAWTGGTWTAVGPDEVYYEVNVPYSTAPRAVLTWQDSQGTIDYAVQDAGVAAFGPEGFARPQGGGSIWSFDPQHSGYYLAAVTFYRDAQDKLFAGVSYGEESDLLSSTDGGRTWDREIGNVAGGRFQAITGRAGALWMALVNSQPDRLGSTLSVGTVVEYAPDPARGRTLRSYRGVEGSLLAGDLSGIAVDSSGSAWLAQQATAYRDNSPWWFFVPALACVALAYAVYARQPGARLQPASVRRLLDPTGFAREETARLLLACAQSPPDTLALIYRTLRDEPQDPAFLKAAAAQWRAQGREDEARAAEAVAALPREAAALTGDAMQAFAAALNATHDLHDAPELAALYDFMARAAGVLGAARIAEFKSDLAQAGDPAAVRLPGRTAGAWLGLPAFIGQGTRDTLAALRDVATQAQAYVSAETTQEGLVALADAVAAAGRAARAAGGAALPERPFLSVVAQKWADTLQHDLTTAGGSAQLRLELRTRQMRRAAQLVVAMRLSNTGAVAAENLSITLSPGADYEPAGDVQVTHERLSSGRSVPLEFAIRPRGDSARIACRMTWDDRMGQGHTLDFADQVRFDEDGGAAFQRIANPYVVGPPVKSADLFRGREDIFQFIRDNLGAAGQERAFVLHGQRRTGKTSILYQLIDGRLGPGYIPVLIDMQELAMLVENTGDFWAEIAYQMGRALHTAGVAVEAPPPEAFGAAATRTFDRFLDDVLDRLGERRLLLMIDEFELLETKISEGKLDPDLPGYIRSLLQHKRGLVFMFVGTRLEQMGRDYWSILFNIALYRRVTFLDAEEAARLIREPVAGSLEIDALAVEKIVALTSGHPYFVQLLCWALVNHCNDRRRNYATLDDVADVVREILATGSAHFAYIWQAVQGEQRLVLSGVAHALQSGKDWARPADVLETLSASGNRAPEPAALVPLLDRLVTQEILIAAGEGALRYRFQIEILRQWIVATQSLAALAERQ